MKKFLIAALVGIISLLMIGVVSADHSWNNYHWRSDNLSPTVLDKTTSSLYDISANVADWVALGTPLNPTITTAKKGNITVSEASSTSWLGLARIFLDDGHITKGQVKLNTRLLAGYGVYAAKHVACQEIGHVLGLNHVTTDSCMNDTSGTLGSFTLPNAHDAEELNAIYAHEDETSNGNPGKPVFWPGRCLTRIMHKFSTASPKSLGLTVRPAKRVPTPSASSAYPIVRLQGSPTRKRVPPPLSGRRFRRFVTRTYALYGLPTNVTVFMKVST